MSVALGIRNDEQVAVWCVADGTRITVRHLRSDDQELEANFLRSLSERSRYFRLLSPLQYISSDLLAHLLDVDGDTRVALVATVEFDGRERFVAVARFARTDQADTAELGITVADAWHRRGIARRMLGLLLECAHDRGFKKLIGFVLPENHAMLELARKLGFDIHFDAATRLEHIEIDTSTAVVPGGLQEIDEWVRGRNRSAQRPHSTQ